MMFASRLNQRKMKSIAFYIGSWIFFCLLYTFFRCFGTSAADDMVVYLSTIQFALLAGLSHGIYDVIILHDDSVSKPVPAALLIRLCYFTAVVCTNISICILVQNWYVEGSFFGETGFHHLWQAVNSPRIQAFAIYGVFCGFFITFIRSVNKKFGSSVFVNAFLGKTQNPKEIELIFMFVDLKNSTRLAEKMGHIQYSQFLKEYYRLLSNCCEENGGDIYQIAGDGVYLTWKMSACRKKPKPLLCFDDLEHCFLMTRKRFTKRFGTYPEFKAAAHVGKVTKTEVGNFRSEMAYHGDAVNTTARMQDLCRDLDEDFLLSEKLLKRLPGVEKYNPHPRGAFYLKGKSGKTSIYALRFSAQKNA